MRLQEAAARAGAASTLPLLGRPTCMALPAAMAHGSVMSTGCIGNRVYTGLGDDELYLMIPGPRLADVVRELAVISSANDTLRQYHQQRRAALTSSCVRNSGVKRHRTGGQEIKELFGFPKIVSPDLLTLLFKVS